MCGMLYPNSSLASQSKIVYQLYIIWKDIKRIFWADSSKSPKI